MQPTAEYYTIWTKVPSAMPISSLFLSALILLASCLSEDLDGESIRAAAFSDPPSAVSQLTFGGSRWTEIDIWVAWAGPANLKSKEGYQPCVEPQRIAAYFAKKDTGRATMLGATGDLSCLEKPGNRTGRWFLSHSTGVHWWRAWDHN